MNPIDFVYNINIGGQDVSSDFQPILEDIEVFDGSDNEADTANLTISDVDGRTFLADARDPVIISLGRPSIGAGHVFQGYVDAPESSGDADGGRKITLECSSVDQDGEGKKVQEKSWDDTTLGAALQDAFSSSGVNIEIDPMFASMQRKFEAMDGRDAFCFAADMAREVGATFKAMGPRAVFAQRNTGFNLLGVAMPLFVATAGDNLISWKIRPLIPKYRFGDIGTRWFDFKKNLWVEETAKSKGKVPLLQTRMRPNQGQAKEGSDAGKTDTERETGAGSITVKGDFRAQAGGMCMVAGARAGVDGAYIISSVRHKATVSQGFISEIELKYPNGTAGVDNRT